MFRENHASATVSLADACGRGGALLQKTAAFQKIVANGVSLQIRQRKSFCSYEGDLRFHRSDGISCPFVSNFPPGRTHAGTAG